MRILHFVPIFSPLSESFVYDFVTEMFRQGVESTVVTMRRVNERTRPYDRVRVLAQPLAVYVARLVGKTISVFSPGRAMDLDALGLGKVLSEMRPELVWAHFGPSGLHAAGACSAVHVPLFVTFHGHDIFVANAYWKARYRAMFARADRVLAVSEEVRNALLEAGAQPARISVLHNGIRLGDFPYSDPARRFDGRHVNLLQVSRLVEKKDPIGLLRAFSIAMEKAPASLELSLTIAGDGPLKSKVAQVVGSLGLGRNVRLLGAVPRNRVAQLLGESHIYTQLSRTAIDGDRDGLPVSITEAMCAGLPVIAAGCGGIAEIVLNGVNGRLVPEGDTRALARELLEVAIDPSLWTRYGSAGRIFVENNFQLDVQVGAAIRLAESALSRRMGRAA